MLGLGTKRIFDPGGGSLNIDLDIVDIGRIPQFFLLLFMDDFGLGD